MISDFAISTIYMIVITIGVFGVIWLFYFYLFLYNRQYINLKKDLQLIFLKNGRYTIINKEIKDGKFEFSKNKYSVPEGKMPLNKWGKSLSINSEGKIAPATLSYNEQKWLDIKTLTAMLNNELLQEIFKPKDKFIDILIIVCCFASVIGGIASVMVALKFYGVVK